MTKCISAFARKSHLILLGMSSMLDISAQKRIVIPQDDEAAIAEDFAAVGRDISTAMHKFDLVERKGTASPTTAQ